MRNEIQIRVMHRPGTRRREKGRSLLLDGTRLRKYDRDSATMRKERRSWTARRRFLSVSPGKRRL